MFFVKNKGQDKITKTELYNLVLHNFRDGKFIDRLKKMYPEFSGYIESIIPYKIYKRIKCPCCGGHFSGALQSNRL